MHMKCPQILFLISSMFLRLFIALILANMRQNYRLQKMVENYPPLDNLHKLLLMFTNQRVYVMFIICLPVKRSCFNARFIYNYCWTWKCISCQWITIIDYVGIFDYARNITCLLHPWRREWQCIDCFEYNIFPYHVRCVLLQLKHMVCVNIYLFCVVYY